MAKRQEIEFRFPEDLQSTIYRNWGLHSKRYKNYEQAIKQFKKSYECRENNRANLEMCKCYKATGAYNDAIVCTTKCKDDSLLTELKEAAHLHRDCIYYLNHLEEAARHSYNIHRQYPNDWLGKSFGDAICLNISLATGKAAGPYLRHFAWLHTKRTADKVKANDESHAADSIEIDNCDVESLCDEREIEKSPMIQKKFDIRVRNRHTLYFDGSIADDIGYWANILKRKAHVLPQLAVSSGKMTKIIESGINKFKTSEQVLWSREPIFARTAAVKKNNQCRQRSRYYLQDTIRRRAFGQLISLKKLIKTNQSLMIKYVENIMTEFYAITPESMFPRKFEFLNDIYNIIGLTYISNIIEIPHNFMLLPQPNRLLSLLNIKQITPAAKRPEQTEQSGEQQQSHAKRFNRKSNHFQDRLMHSQYTIEEVYLTYQLSRIHFDERKLEECQKYSEDCVHASQFCQSALWEFLALINIVRIYSVKENFVRVKTYLDDLQNLSRRLNQFVIDYVNVLSELIDQLLNTHE